jgi:hypothetical protein
LTVDEAELKERIVALRDKVVGHSDEELMRFRGAVVELDEESTVAVPLFQYSEALLLSEADLELLIRLLHRLIREISAALFALAQVTPERLDVYRAPAQSLTAVL